MHWIRRHRRGRPPHPDVLTPAEWRVLEEIRLGRTNAEIAVRTGLSINTVRTHLSSIYAKTGLTDREALRRWDGRPAAAPQAGGRRLGLGAWLTGGTAVGGVKVAVAGVAAVVFLGALFAVYSVFAEDDHDAGVERIRPQPQDPQWVASFPTVPCGVEVLAGTGFYGDAEAWECFLEALDRGEQAQLLAMMFPHRSTSYRGDGVARLYTAIADGRIDVIEATYDQWQIAGQRRYTCSELTPARPLSEVDGWSRPDVESWLADLASGRPGSEIALEGCTEPVEGQRWMLGGSEEVVLCGIEYVAFTEPEGFRLQGRQCLIDALENGAPAQFFSVSFLGHPHPSAEVFTVVAPGRLQVYGDAKGPGFNPGRYMLECTELRGSPLEAQEEQIHFRTWWSDCTQPRLLDGPPMTCGTDLVAGNRRFGDPDASWECLRRAWERGVRAQTFVTTLTSEGDGTSRLYVAGRGSPEEGYRFNYGVMEVEFEDFRVVARTYYGLCGQEGAEEPGVDDCMGRPYRTDGLDRGWEPMPWGGAVLCGVEVAREQAHANQEARECPLEAFEAANPAQMLSIRFTSEGDPVSEVITAFEPGVVHVYRDSWARGEAGMFLERCTALERLDDPFVFVAQGCVRPR